VVSAAPNLTRIAGTVLARRPHPTLSGWDLVTLAVEATSPVEGSRDLVGPRLAESPGGAPAELEVAVRRELLGDAVPGWHVTARVKVTPDGPMARPHPGDGEFGVEAPGPAGPAGP
jgi:hypothetical protein